MDGCSKCEFVCVGDGDFALHLNCSLITHSSYRYSSEPVTTLSNMCQEADSMIITSQIKQKFIDITVAMPRLQWQLIRCC